MKDASIALTEVAKRDVEAPAIVLWSELYSTHHLGASHLSIRCDHSFYEPMLFTDIAEHIRK